MKNFLRWLLANRRSGVPLRDGWLAKWHQGEAIELVRGDYVIVFEVPALPGWPFETRRVLDLGTARFEWQPPHKEEPINENARNELLALVKEAVEFERQKLIIR